MAWSPAPARARPHRPPRSRSRGTGGASAPNCGCPGGAACSVAARRSEVGQGYRKRPNPAARPGVSCYHDWKCQKLNAASPSIAEAARYKSKSTVINGLDLEMTSRRAASVPRTANRDMPTSTTPTNHDNQKTDKHIDPIISKMTGLVDDLNDALIESLDRSDSRQIIQGIAAAICVQELTRIAVTKIKMDARIRSAIDPECVRSDWQVLSRHYAGAKHARILDHGVAQLEKLNPKQAREVIFAIRRSMEPSLNWAMEEKVVKIGLALPVVGKLGIGNLYFNLRGTRVAMRSLRGRLLRLVVQGALWLAVASGTVHRMSWTFFHEPYLTSTFGSLAKFTQFLLLMSTTLVVWALTRV